ncbi:hypothetical protein FRC04_010143 [Tulasnella sp. 424]|nr:hypothetical protein FRC04_010143 [Tulasnella sp. 424]KAG8972550.1 hypothetical protein FRC05_009783 [Tulasnella sp. 425]
MAPSTPSSSSANTTSVQVAVRIRPSNEHDLTSIPTRFQRTVVHGTSPTSVTVEPSTIPPTTANTTTSSAAANPLAKKQAFNFDQVHAQGTTQHAIFTSTAAPLVSRFLQGFNCTILAYGQTSSGKTYTMTGVDLDADPSDSDNGMGIIPRAVATIFSAIQQLKQERGNAWNCSVRGSFIEIYNEDLIDLLAPEDPSMRREVQIREEKDGTIIWSGLREVGVKSTGEVMNLIRQGSSIRRTNETDMNAQSSRSHAIFSLTLTQKKYTGSGTPRSVSGRTSPMPPSTPSPSRLARPSSVYVGSGTGRVGSPTFGRPPTPSFASAMRSAGAGLRPQSAMALRPGTPDQEDAATDSGAWVTVVSKFHFVDLAGSERLKRTAAQGERIKEGISINSGLLALGNVISALGDPSRARTLAPGQAHIHVPYRDSKLTRLLQDSLGGNSHTLMIACVSPAEWNALETVNTLKYANRARNIKNRAEVREKEDGWDDLEWLQGMVTKLRKELKTMKEGGAITSGAAEDGSSGQGAANAKMIQKYNELQGMHEELRMRYNQANDELRRSKQELEDRPLMSPTSTQDRTANIRRYEEIVAPVIEQYEKTISAMEAELKLNRTALAHTNEMYEEQETELEALKERHSTTEAYVEELRARVGKLVEREASTESYVRDLEQKLKSFSETSLSSSESLNDVKKEIARYKENEVATTTYIAELEARLARSDSDVSSLKSMVERLEGDLERRATEVERLEAKLDAVLDSPEYKEQQKMMNEWKAELEEREKKVSDLEKQMSEWEKIRQEVNAERKRLNEIAEGQKREIEQQMLKPPASDGGFTPAGSVMGSPAPMGLKLTMDVSANASPVKGTDVPLPPSPDEFADIDSSSPEVLRDQLLSLRETHGRTLEDLNGVTSKYRDALREISDLAAQINESKLQLAQQGSPLPNGLGYASSGEPGSDADSGAITPRSARTPLNGSPVMGARRRRTLPRNNSGEPIPPLAVNGTGKRLLFRSAASAESLHSRSQSQSLSQELSLARLPRDASWPSLGGESLLSPTLAPKSPMRMSLQLPGEKRSVQSMEKEIMRLQEVLKEREAEITVLEKSLDAFERSRSTRANSPSYKTSSDVLDERDELAEEANNAQGSPNGERALSPSTRGRFEELKKSLEHDPSFQSSPSPEGGEDSLDRLNELMRSMAQKESQHKETVETLNRDLQTVRKQYESLVKDRSGKANIELESLRSELIASREEKLAASRQLEELRRREQALLEERRSVEARHTEEIEVLQSEHDAQLDKLRVDHEDLLRRMAEENEDAVQYSTAKARREAELAATSQLESSLAALATEHESVVAKLTTEHDNELRKHEMQVESVLARTRADHERAISRLRGEHEEALRARAVESTSVADAKKSTDTLVAQHAATIRRMEEAHEQELLQATTSSQDLLNRVRQEFEDSLKAAEVKHEEAIRVKQEESANNLRRTREGMEAAISRLRSEHEETLARKTVEFETQLQRLRDEHAAELRQKEIALEGSLSESQSDTANVVKQLQEEYAAALERRDVSTREDLENLKADHERQLSSRAADHEHALTKLQEDHSIALATLESSSGGEVNRLKEALASSRQEHANATDALRAELAKVQADFETQRSKLAADHEVELLQLKADHQAALTDAQAALVAAQELHQKSLADSRADLENKLASDNDHHRVALEELTATHDEERDTLRKAHNLLAEELETHKSMLNEARIELEQNRQLHKTDADDLRSRLTTMEEHLQSVMTERASYAAQAEELRATLDNTKSEQAGLIQEASKRESLVQELERHRSILGESQTDLQRTRDERDTLLAEKQRQDSLIKELQAQLAGAKAHKREGSGDSAPSHGSSRLARANGIPPAKLPPLTPPPTGPPPPTPGSVDFSMSSHPARTSSSSQPSRSATPDEQTTPSTSMIMSPTSGVDPKIASLIEEQAKHLEEQEAMIKTLNKQLTHCEADLQAHMDLVATLEASLTDSERNLRKARMQSNELAKERDSYLQQMNGLRAQVTEAQREASNMRRSVAEEKLSLEHRLEEERRAKERARAQLESRMEEMAKRKSKFVCL